MSFCLCSDKKDVAKNICEVHQELGGGEIGSLSNDDADGNENGKKAIDGFHSDVIKL